MARSRLGLESLSATTACEHRTLQSQRDLCPKRVSAPNMSPGERVAITLSNPSIVSIMNAVPDCMTNISAAGLPSITSVSPT
eukprot:CAMPEP_0180238894 /NCGR_PEP_ID=MMETSP0987-20121128/31208_1 /TAXON_ID=697907 /ORGANISM="non described non described, Strain CCMP2293" /LENGTH=81 /DNA_ID=CAMNT_0022205521 /DNA_START=215 /DNA_END=457 /DNA_ORIENTATION=+